MNTFKNYLIALLTGLLVLSFSSQVSQGASKPTTPVTLSASDLTAIANAVPYVSLPEQTKLVEYGHCLTQMARATTVIDPAGNIAKCAWLKP